MLFSTGDRSNIGFKTAKSSFWSVSVSPNQCYCMTCYEYLGEHLDRTLHFEMHFPNFWRRQQEEWTSYGTSVPALMLLAPNKFINQWLQYANIKPIAAWMVRALQLLDSLHWDPKPQNHFLQMQSAGLWPVIFNNWKHTIFTQENMLLRIWLPKWNCMFSILKDYFWWLHHNALNIRNNGKSAKLPKVRFDFECHSFLFFRCYDF